MIEKKDITVVVRSAGERTLNASVELLQAFFSADQIQVIEEVPFSQAVRRSLEIGLAAKRPWLLCVDADVLVSREGIENLFKVAKKAPPEIFEIQGLIFDKFFPVLRPSGARFYRTIFAPKALDLIPKEGSTLRPESSLLNAMAREGHPWLQCDAVVGVHDFEQYYRDIFRKCFLQGHKHRQIIPLVLDYWVEQSLHDPDFKAGLLGILYGQSHAGTVLVDRRFKEEEIDRILTRQGFIEKDNGFQATEEYVNQLLKTDLQPRFSELQKQMMPPEKLNRVAEIPRTSYSNPGLIAKVLYKTGNLFIRAGEKFRGKAVSLTGKK